MQKRENSLIVNFHGKEVVIDEKDIEPIASKLSGLIRSSLDKELIEYITSKCGFFDQQPYHRSQLLMQYIYQGMCDACGEKEQDSKKPYGHGVRGVFKKANDAALYHAEKVLWHTPEFNTLLDSSIARKLRLGELMLPKAAPFPHPEGRPQDKDYMCLHILNVVLDPKGGDLLQQLIDLFKTFLGIAFAGKAKDEKEESIDKFSELQKYLSLVLNSSSQNFGHQLVDYLKIRLKKAPPSTCPDLSATAVYNHFGIALEKPEAKKLSKLAELFKSLPEEIKNETRQRQSILAANDGTANPYCTALLSRPWLHIDKIVNFFEQAIQGSKLIKAAQPFRVEDEQKKDASATTLLTRLIARLDCSDEVKLAEKDLYYHQLIIIRLARTYDVDPILNKVVISVLLQLERDCEDIIQEQSQKTTNLAWNEHFCKIIHLFRAMRPKLNLESGQEAKIVIQDLLKTINKAELKPAAQSVKAIQNFFTRCYAQPCFENIKENFQALDHQESKPDKPLWAKHFSYLLADPQRKSAFKQAMQKLVVPEDNQHDYAFNHFGAFLTACFQGSGLDKEILDFIQNLKQIKSSQADILKLWQWCFTIIRAIPEESLNHTDRDQILSQIKLQCLNHLEYAQNEAKLEAKENPLLEGKSAERVGLATPTISQCLDVLNVAVNRESSLKIPGKHLADCLSAKADPKKADPKKVDPNSPVQIAYTQVMENPRRKLAAQLFCIFQVGNFEGVSTLVRALPVREPLELDDKSSGREMLSQLMIAFLNY